MKKKILFFTFFALTLFFLVGCRKIKKPTNHFCVETQNVDVLTQNVDLAKIEEGKEISFKIVLKDDEEIVSLLINGSDKKEIIKDNIFSIKVLEDTTIRLIKKTIEKTPEVSYFSVTLENVELKTSKIDLNKVLENTRLSFTIPSKKHMMFKQLFINGEDKTDIIKDNSFKYDVFENLHINAIFEPEPTYKLEIPSNVTLLTEGVDINRIYADTNLSFKINFEKPDHKITKVLLNGNDVTDYFISILNPDNTFDIPMPEQDTVLSIEIKYLKRYSVNLDGVKLEDASLDSSNLLEGVNKFKLIIPEHYSLNKILVDGELKDIVIEDDCFEYNIDKNLEIKAIYKEDPTYSIVVQDFVEVLTSGINLDKLYEGSVVEFKINFEKPDYIIKQVTKNTEDITESFKASLSSTNTFTLVVGKENIVLNIEIKYFNRFKVELEGVKLKDTTLDPNNLLEGNHEFLLVKEENQALLSLLINGEDKTLDVVDDSFTFKINTNTTIKATYIVRRYFDLNVEGFEIISPLIPLTHVLEDTKLKFKLQTPENKKLVDVKLDGVLKTLDHEGCIEIVVKDNHNLVATFRELEKYRLQVENFKVLTAGIDLENAVEDSVILFSLDNPENKKLISATLDGASITFLPNNEFSLTVTKAHQLIAVLRDYKYYQLDIEGVKVLTPSIDLANVKEDSLLEFSLQKEIFHDFIEIQIDGLKTEIEITDNKFNLTITKSLSIKAVYNNLFNPTITIDDIEVGSEITNLLIDEEHTIKFNNLTYNGISYNPKNVTAENVVLKPFAQGENQVVITPVSELGIKTIKLIFTFDGISGDILFSKEIEINYIDDFARKILVIEEQYSKYEKAYLFSQTFQGENFAKFAKYAEFADSIRGKEGLVEQVLAQVNKGLISQLNLFYSVLNSGWFLKGRVLIKKEFTKLPDQKQNEIENTFKISYNKFNDGVEALLSALVNYLDANYTENGKTTLPRLITDLTYYVDYYKDICLLSDEIKNITNFNDNYNKLKAFKDEYNNKGFNSIDDATAFLKDPANEFDAILELFKKASKVAEKNKLDLNVEKVKQYDLAKVEKAASDAMKFFDGLQNAIIPAAKKDDVEFLKHSIETLFKYAQSTLKYIYLLQENYQILQTQKIIFTEIIPRVLIRDIFISIFQIKQPYPVKLDTETDTEYKARVDSWQDASIGIAKAALNLLDNDYFSDANIENVKKIAEPIFLDIPFVIAKNSENKYVLLENLLKRNRIIKTL